MIIVALIVIPGISFALGLLTNYIIYTSKIAKMENDHESALRKEWKLGWSSGWDTGLIEGERRMRLEALTEKKSPKN